MQAFDKVLPCYLKGLSENPNMVLPDSTTEKSPQNGQKSPKNAQNSPELPDLSCSEQLSNDSNFTNEDSLSFLAGNSNSRSSSPLSAVDIFTEYNTIFDQADEEGQSNTNGPLDSPFSILVS